LVLGHPAREFLDAPFVEFIGNKLSKAESHFWGLREAVKDLLGVVILDHQDNPPDGSKDLAAHFWSRNEIENYLSIPEVLVRYAEKLAVDAAGGPLFEEGKKAELRQTMEQCANDLIPAAARRDRSHRWWSATKMTDDFLDLVFADFFKKLSLPNLMMKTDYHRLVGFMTPDEIDAEVVGVLDTIVNIAKSAERRAPKLE
jgi:hypothetical protein